MKVLESKEVTINGNYYVFTAMDALDGLDCMNKFMSISGIPPAADIRNIIVKNVKLGGKAFNEKSFGVHFSRNYEELMQVFEEYMAFNFGEFDPNDGSDTPKDSENEGTSEK